MSRKPGQPAPAQCRPNFSGRRHDDRTSVRDDEIIRIADVTKAEKNERIKAINEALAARMGYVKKQRKREMTGLDF